MDNYNCGKCNLKKCLMTDKKFNTGIVIHNPNEPYFTYALNDWDNIEFITNNGIQYKWTIKSN